MKKRRVSIAAAAFALLMLVTAVIGTGVPAKAEGPGQITITPNGQALEPVDRFVAYQIFSGTTDSTPEQLSNIEWGANVDGTTLIQKLQEDTTEVQIGYGGSAETKQFKDVFTEAYTQYQSSYEGEISDAQFVADWLAEHADDRDIVDAFARIVALNVKDAGTASTVESENWVIKNLNPGYYLVIDTFVSADDNPDGEKTDNSVSTYILEVVGGEVTVELKATLPTVEKKVEDQKGFLTETEKEIHFTITGTVAENIDEYETYAYTFTDVLDKGLTIDESTIKVTMKYNTENDDFVQQLYTWPSVFTKKDSDTGDYTVTKTENSPAEGQTTVKISFENLKKSILDAWNKQVTEGHWQQAPSLTRGMANRIIIEVTYTAKLNENAVTGQDGNTNSVTLEYSNNPYSQDKGETIPDDVKTYTLSLDVNKVDENGAAITEAKFRIRLKEGGDNVYLKAKHVTGESDYYEVVSWDGTKDGTEEASDPVDIFKVGEDGKLHIHGLGLGTYVLEEVATKEGYELMKPLEFTIAATDSTDSDGIEDDDSAGTFSTTVTVTPVTEGREDASVEGGTFQDNTAALKIINYPSPVLPHTGGISAMVVYALSSLALVLGAVFVVFSVRRRRQ